MHIFSQKFYLFLVGSLFMVVFGTLSGCGDLKGQSSELNLDGDKAPFGVNFIRGLQRPIGKPLNETILLCDIDGDGVKECVEGTYQKLLGYDTEDSTIKPRWEIHLDDDHHLSNKSSRLGVTDDLNDDGIEEIFFVTMAKDHSGWNYCVLDPATQEIIVNTPLPLGENRRRPDYWDGYYSADGILHDADGKGNPGIVLVRTAMYDATLRGVCVVEPFTGKVIWEYIGAAQPATDRAVVTDIDGDGSREITFPTSAPGNWGNSRINGTLDIESYLIVLSNHGEELMRVVLGGERFVADVVAEDLDGDGIKELITATQNGNVGHTNELIVWDWKTKKACKRVRSTMAFDGLAVTQGPRSGTAYIFTGTDEGTFHRYLYDGETLSRDRLITHDTKDCRLVGAVDILPLPGDEVLVQVIGLGKTVIMDRDFNTQGVYTSDSGYSNIDPLVWEMPDDKKALILADPHAYWMVDLEKKPFDWAGKMLPVGGSLLGLSILLTTFYFGVAYGRKKLKAAAAPVAEIIPGTDFDALFRLQQELEDANHSVVGRTKGLERMVWLLDAYIAEEGTNKELELRIRQVMEDYQVEVKPRLFRLLHLAEQASFETGTVSEVTRSLLSLSGRIDQLYGKDLNLEVVRSMRTELQADWKSIKEGFFLLRDASNTYFTTDPVRLIQGMLLVREGDFQREKIKTTMLGDSGQPGVMSCRIDNGDLRFVMDNLLDNALRSMKESSSRQLTVEVSRIGKEVGLRITDTGNGIAKVEQEAIFSSRFSSRRGGGRGLHRSREILARWGSEILLTDSEPGKGTTFVVKLLAAGEEPGQKTMAAQG